MDKDFSDLLHLVTNVEIPAFFESNYVCTI